jgi:hypothetical protein
MKASGIRLEFEIQLSQEEIINLQTKAIQGKIKIYDTDKNLGTFPLELIVGKTNEQQLFAELQTMPRNVYIDEIKEYKIIVSQIGYEELKEKGTTGDRMFNNPGCKILIKNQTIYKYL